MNAYMIHMSIHAKISHLLILFLHDQLLKHFISFYLIMMAEQKNLGIIFGMDTHMNLMSIHAKNHVHGSLHSAYEYIMKIIVIC